MGRDALRAVVCTSTLDLGVDWGCGRPCHPGRRAQGHRAHAAAHRPLQPSHGRALPRPDGAGQPVRACSNAALPWKRSTTATLTARRARRAGSTCLPSTSWGLPASGPFDPNAALPRGHLGAALCRARPAAVRPGRRVRRDRRLRAARLRPLQAALPGAGGPPAHRQRAGRPPVPHERRHHRRGADAEGRAAERPRPGRDRGILHPRPGARRHLRLRRPHLGAGADPRHRGRGAAGEIGDGQGSGLRRRQVPAHHQRRRAPARHPRRAAAPPAPAARRPGMAAHPGSPFCPAAPGRAAGRDLPEERQGLDGLLPVRGAPGAPDAGHAADPSHGAGGSAADGLHVQRLRAGDLEPRPGRGDGRALRRGHAGRRPGRVDGRIEPVEAYLPQRWCRGRPDRAAPSGQVEVGPPGHLQLGPALRRAAPLRARPRPASGGTARGGRRPARRAPAGRYAAPREGPHHPQAAGTGLAAGRADHAGSRAQPRGRRRRRCAARRGRGAPDRRSHEVVVMDCAATPSTCPSPQRGEGGARRASDGRVRGTRRPRPSPSHGFAMGPSLSRKRARGCGGWSA